MESIMSESDRVENGTAQRISALLDGELAAAEVADTCRAWRTDARLCADWHAYSLIGDVLRATDLAHPPARDQAFLGALRERLALEPVVLAPASAERLQPDPVAAAVNGGTPAAVTQLHARRPRWVTPLGIAAGVAMVAGLAWTMRPPAPEPLQQIARMTLPQPLQPVEPAARVDAVVALAPDSREQLEPYLNAHRMVPAKAAFGPAPGFMRSVAHEPGSR
jgi:sigma-E factor negative regulatory protein RseA